MPILGTGAHISLISTAIYEDSRTHCTQPNTSSLVCPQEQSPLPISRSEVVDLDELPDTDLQNRSSLPISISEVVDLDEFPDFDLDTGLAFVLRGK